MSRRTQRARSPVTPRDELALAQKLTQPEVRRRAAPLTRGERISAPIAVDLDPTSFCDLACPGCISGDLLGQARFTTDRLERLADELVAMDVRAVVLIGGGEPLMHPATATVAERLSRAGVAVGLVTNGTLLDRHLDVLRGSLSWLRVSLDAATPETYGAVRPGRRGVNKFAEVLANIRLATGHHTLKVGISYVVFTARPGSLLSNVEEIPGAASLAVDLGCDYVEFKAELADDHSIADVDSATVDLIDRRLRRAEERTAGTPVRVLRSSSLTALLAGRPDQDKGYSMCPTAQLRTTITPSGVFACAYHRGKPGFRLGDVQSAPLRDVWDAADFTVVDPRRACRFHCARHDANRLILDGIPLAAESSGGPADWFI